MAMSVDRITRAVNSHDAGAEVCVLSNDGVFADVEFIEWPRERVTLMLDEVQREVVSGEG